MTVFLIDGTEDNFAHDDEAVVEGNTLVIYRTRNRLVDQKMVTYPLTSVLKWVP